MLPQRIRNIRARGDSSVFDGGFLEELEKGRIEYAIAAKLYVSIQYLLGGLDYRGIGDDIAVGEFHYQWSWKKERRLVVIREALSEAKERKKEFQKLVAEVGLGHVDITSSR